MRSLNNSISSSIISFSGNVIGGLIGGAVAYFVASVQIQKTLEVEEGKSRKANAAVLRIILIELETNKRILEQSRSLYLNDERYFLNFVSSNHWEKCSRSIGLEVEKETLSSIMSIHNKFQLLKSDTEIISDEQYSKLIEEMSLSIKLI